MNRIFTYLSLLLLLLGCEPNQNFHVSEQTLRWAILEEVSDIRSQICIQNGQYFLVTDREVCQLNDTNPSTKPILLASFPDSLWKTVTDLEYPNDTAYTPEEFGSNYTRGMPDFLIEKINVLDSAHLLLFLTFNS